MSEEKLDKIIEQHQHKNSICEARAIAGYWHGRYIEADKCCEQLEAENDQLRETMRHAIDLLRVANNQGAYDVIMETLTVNYDYEHDLEDDCDE